MSREAHVRFCEGLEVKFLRPTRHGANWTLDVAMKEDHSSPCQRGEALVVISWLRLLAYNLVSIFRSKQPKRHGDKLSWNRAFELLKRVFLMDGEIKHQLEMEQTTQHV